MTTPIISNVKRHNGVAGQFSVSATVAYPDELSSRIEFVGSVFGGPVVMITPVGQTFVTDPARFGKLSPLWVRRFFGIEA